MSKEDRRAGTCNFSPGPMTCLSCPFPECTNNRPPVRGEDGVEKYVNLTDGTKENAMKTKYSVGDTVKVGAKIEKIEIDEKGVKYMLSSGFWKGFKEVRESDLSSGLSKSIPKTSAKNGKTLAKTEKTLEKTGKASKNEKNGRKTEEIKEKQQGSTGGAEVTERQQDTAKRQQERKRPGRPSKKAVGKNEGTTTAAGLKELAEELARTAK